MKNITNIDYMNSLNEIVLRPFYASLLNEQLLNNSDSSSNLYSLAKNDLLISLLILKTANSSFYGVSKQIKTLAEAISLIGENNTNNIIKGMSFKKLDDSKFSKIMDNNLWVHSYTTAFVSLKIAQFLQLERPDEYFFASLFHDVGLLFVMNDYPHEYNEFLNIAKEDHCLYFTVDRKNPDLDHSLLGSKILESFQLPEFIIKVAKYHHTPFSMDKDSIVYKKFILVANLADICSHRINLDTNLDIWNGNYDENILWKLGLDINKMLAIEKESTLELNPILKLWGLL